MSGKNEYGDYQTPSDFAGQVCSFLKYQKRISPQSVIEPTCGVGNFLKASMIFDADRYYGIEIRHDYCDICRSRISDRRVRIIESDVYDYDIKRLTGADRVLAIGNPPWVTSSDLSSMGSANVPTKTNFKKLKGLEAVTGAGGFDICEYIILELIHAYAGTDAQIAMLCKTSVARNIFMELRREKISFDQCEIYQFDAKDVFGVSVNACLLFIRLAEDQKYQDICNIYSFDNPDQIISSFGYVDGRLFSNIQESDDDFDGRCCFEWRQGVKHDCSKIMELRKVNGQLINGNGNPVDIEDTYVYPLVKSSMFKTPVISAFSRYVIVTQKKIREDTSQIEYIAPDTWKYLNDNISYFTRRKSSIYRNAPDFSMFGIGDYSFSEYKVGVSGFYKDPMFSVLYSKEMRPVMTDDTSYFICFDSYDMAYVAMLYLNSERVKRFLQSIAFIDAKRPFTKKVLGRIDFNKVCSEVRYNELIYTEHELGLKPHVSRMMIHQFKKFVSETRQSDLDAV